MTGNPIDPHTNPRLYRIWEGEVAEIEAYQKRRRRMPSKTAKQHRAMAAAAHGKGNLGIPKSVAKEFLKADKKAGGKKGK